MSPARIIKSPRDRQRTPGWAIGLLAVVLILVGSYLAYVKELPFGSDGYRLTATFDNVATLRTSAPVRIAGVNVGEVSEVESKGDAVAVTFTVDEAGQPVHEDAQVTIRPRLFLEGNFFLDLRPGSPSAPELPDDGHIPVTRTAVAVQLDEILTSLQSDSRRNLQRLLEGYGTALTYPPSAEDDATQDPAVHGETAAESLNDTFEYGGPAGKSTAIVSDALRGQNPHDLSQLIRAQRDVFMELRGHESELQGLITNFNVFAGALAAESQNLSASLRELAPTVERARPSLLHLSQALPPLRAWARALEPSLRELPGTIEASGPWLDQAALLLREQELGGLADDLGDSARPLAQTSRQATVLLPELTALSRCTSEVLDPAAETEITVDPNDPGNDASVWEEFFYGTVNISGAAGNFDGNGHYLRALAGGGDTLVSSQNPGGPPGGLLQFATTQDGSGFPTRGVQPALPATPPPFEMGERCHHQAPPALNGPAANAVPSDMQVEFP